MAGEVGGRAGADRAHRRLTDSVGGGILKPRAYNVGTVPREYLGFVPVFLGNLNR